MQNNIKTPTSNFHQLAQVKTPFGVLYVFQISLDQEKASRNMRQKYIKFILGAEKSFDNFACTCSLIDHRVS